MNSLLHCLLLLFFTASSIRAFSQDFVCQNINFTKGLSSNSVWGITQDNSGYIWLATSSGVDRFDGNNFLFVSKKNGLSASEALDFFRNNVTGDVYVQMYAGKLSVIKNSLVDTTQNLKLSHFYSTRRLLNITVNQEHKSLFIYSDNIIWETDFGFNILRSIPLHQKPGQILLLFYNKQERLALVRHNNTELLLCREVKGVFEKIANYKEVELPTIKYNSVRNGSCLLFDSRNSIYSFDFETLKLKHICQGNAEISGLFIDSDSIIWYGKNDGVYWLDLKNQSRNGHLLTGHIIGNIFEDKYGHIWITTITNGIYLISQKRINNTDLSGITGKAQTAHSFFKDDHCEIFGFTNNSCAQIRKGKAELIRFSTKEIFNRVTTIISDSGILLMAHEFGVFNLNTRQNCIRGSGLKQFKAIGKNLYATAGLHGLITYNYRNQEFFRADTLVKSKVLTFEKINDTAIVYFSSRGQFIINPRTKTEQPVKFTSGEKPGITGYYKKDSNIYAIGDDGILYILKGNSLIPFLTGLFSEKESIRKILIDSKGDFHAISDRSYATLREFSKNKFNDKVVLNHKNGLSHTLINDVFVRNDTVYIAGNEGVSSFKKSDIINRFPEKVIFTQVTAGNIQIPKAEAFFKLNKNQGDLKIEFHTIDYNFPEQIIYEYRLKRDGEERIWSKTINNSILFSDLQSGDYTFQILACSASNRIKKTKISELRFRKEPKLLENPIALTIIYITSLVSAVCTGHFLMRRKSRIEKKDQEVKQRITQLELLALRSQLDPHFIFNALNSIKDFIRKNDITLSQKYLDDFSLLMRITLDKSKNRNILLTEEIKYLSKYLSIEQMRFNNRFRYSIISADVPAELIFIPSMMLQPFLENAIRHGLIGSLDYEGYLEICFEMPDENYLLCKITDNGKGLHDIHESNTKGIHALHIIKDRINLYNSSKPLKISFEINNRPDGHSGVCVEILLPILYHEND